jgi:hypothetical protein
VLPRLHPKRNPSIDGNVVSGCVLVAVIKMANHADTRTTQLYDRRDDAVSLDEYGKVGI